jgi:hypothetical protein
MISTQSGEDRKLTLDKNLVKRIFSRLCISALVQPLNGFPRLLAPGIEDFNLMRAVDYPGQFKNASQAKSSKP